MMFSETDLSPGTNGGREGVLGVLQSAANLPIAMLAGGKHTLIPGRLEVGVDA